MSEMASHRLLDLAVQTSKRKQTASFWSRIVNFSKVIYIIPYFLWRKSGQYWLIAMIWNLFLCELPAYLILFGTFSKLDWTKLWKGTIFGYKGGKSRACFFGTQPVQDGWVKEAADKSLKRAVFDIHCAVTRIHSVSFTIKLAHFFRKWPMRFF